MQNNYLAGKYNYLFYTKGKVHALLSFSKAEIKTMK